MFPSDSGMTCSTERDSLESALQKMQFIPSPTSRGFVSLPLSTNETAAKQRQLRAAFFQPFEELRWVESFGFGANLRECDTWGYILDLLEKDGAPCVCSPEVRFKLSERDAQVRAMQPPDVPRSACHNPIDKDADRDHSLRSFCVDPDSTARLNAWRSTTQLRCLLARHDPLNEFLLYRNDDVAFTHRCPALRS